jgi:arylsulfatase A-like enzyme
MILTNLVIRLSNSCFGLRLVEALSRAANRVMTPSALAFVVGVSILFSTGCSESRDQPNIVLILADDVGTGDLSVYNPDSLVRTPNIDSIAEAGVLFTDAHSPSSVCAPTRYSLLSGNYPWRGNYPWGAWTFTQGSGFRPDQISLAQLLKANGYQTAMFGKVHLGAEPVYKEGVSAEAVKWNTSFDDLEIHQPLRGGPKDLGFDYSFTAQSGIQAPPFVFFENDLLVAPESELTHFRPGEYPSETGVSVIPKVRKKWKPDRWWGEAGWRSHEFEATLLNKFLDYLESLTSGPKRPPFFIYYATSAVHEPFTPPDAFLGQPVKGQTPTPHLDMMVHLDLVVGEILNFLREQDLIHNTLIIFTSDNGGLWDSAKTGHRSNGGFRGHKGSVWEGGHRVPLIVSWPHGEVPAGVNISSLTGLQDVYATLAEVSGPQIPSGQALDSISFLPQLRGSDSPDRKDMMFQGTKEHSRLAFRVGDLKLITDLKRNALELYDLSADLSEENNLVEDAAYADELETIAARFAEVYPTLLLR